MRESFFQNHLEYIAAVTKVLNELPECNDFYIQVELLEGGSHRKVGSWCDEIAADAWYFEVKE